MAAARNKIIRLLLLRARHTFRPGLSCQLSTRADDHAGKIVRSYGSSSSAKLIVSPQSALGDELVDIRATGLSPGQPAVLRGQVNSECGRFRFESEALYKADNNGEIRVNSQPSLGGTYTGIEPMGPLWSVVPDEQSAKKRARLVKRDVMTPWKYELNITESDDLRKDGRPASDSTVIELHFVAPYTKSIPIDMGSLKGLLSVPRNVSPGSLPLIIDMPRFGPKQPYERGPLLSSHGFAVFSFDYFLSVENDIGYGKNIHLDCQLFHDIVNIARDHPSLDPDRIGINAECYGGTLALNAVARDPDLPIRCLIVQACVDMLTSTIGIQLTDGTRVEPVERPEDYTLVTREADGSRYFNLKSDHRIFDMRNTAEYVAPVEDISIPVLFVICGDDQMMPSEKCLTRAASRMEKAGKGHLLDLLYLDGAGHLLMAPFTPLCKEHALYVPHITGKLYCKHGGKSTLHNQAQKIAWKETISFFRRHLGPVNMRRRDWLDQEHA